MVDELQSSQEEAYTRILLHASDNGYKYVMVVSEDTDVILHCIGNGHQEFLFIREEELKRGQVPGHQTIERCLRR